MTTMKFERLRRGWKQADLSRHVRMAQGDISKAERGRLRPCPAQLRRLSRVLCVPAERLLDPVEFVAVRDAS